MGTSPDQMRAEIAATRSQLSADVDRLADRASPRRMARRRKARMRRTVSGVRDRVMGTASYTAHGMAGTRQKRGGGKPRCPGSHDPDSHLAHTKTPNAQEAHRPFMTRAGAPTDEA